MLLKLPVLNGKASMIHRRLYFDCARLTDQKPFASKGSAQAAINRRYLDPVSGWLSPELHIPVEVKDKDQSGWVIRHKDTVSFSNGITVEFTSENIVYVVFPSSYKIPTKSVSNKNEAFSIALNWLRNDHIFQPKYADKEIDVHSLALDLKKENDKGLFTLIFTRFRQLLAYG